jgi:hypothetical protein
MRLFTACTPVEPASKNDATDHLLGGTKTKTIPAEQPVLRSLHLAGCPIIQIKIEATTVCTGSGSGMKKFLLTGAVSHSRFYQRSENQKNKVYLEL